MHGWRGLALCLLTACASGTATRTPGLPVPIAATPEIFQADSIANLLVQRALTADAALGTADSTWSPEAEVLANGGLRENPPRFAGVGVGGSVQIGSTRIAVTGGFVWGMIEYRWIPPDPTENVVVGLATVIIGRDREGVWRILHLHSSTPPPPLTLPPVAPDTLRGGGDRVSGTREGQAVDEFPRIVSRTRCATPGAKIFSSV